MSLLSSSAKSVLWNGLSTAMSLLVQVTQMVILTRLLMPEDFGLMATVLVVLNLADLISDMGIGNSLIQRANTTREEFSSVFWLNIAFGLGIFLAISTGGRVFALLFSEPRLTGIMHLAALSFLVTPFGLQYRALLQKELEFRILGTCEILGFLASLCVSSALAYAGYGVLALVWGYLAAQGTATLLIVGYGLRRWPPVLGLRLQHLRGHLAFGLYQIGERTVYYLTSRVDQMLLAAMQGATQLGYYSFSTNLAYMPMCRINAIFTRVAFPAFSLIQNDRSRMAQGYFVMIRTIALINFPILLGLAGAAPVLVPACFGEKWLPAVPFLQIICAAQLLKSLHHPSYTIVLARGKAGLQFNFSALMLVLLIPSIVIGIRLDGASGAALASLAVNALETVLGYFILIRPILGPSLGEYFAAFSPSLAISGAMALATWSLGTTLSHALPQALLLVGFGAVLYAALTLAFNRPALRQLRRGASAVRGTDPAGEQDSAQGGAGNG